MRIKIFFLGNKYMTINLKLYKMTKNNLIIPFIIIGIIVMFANSCKKESNINPVKLTVTTSTVTNITQTTANCGGKVTNKGVITISARGVCWSTSVNPTIANSKTTDGADTGSFTSRITGLTANTLYHIRAYAADSSGAVYGSDSSFTTKQGYGNAESYADSLSRLYFTFAVPDPIGYDLYFGDYLRALWNLQELPTDEAICAWNDATIRDLHNQNYTPGNLYTSVFYSRLFHEINLCNKFIIASDNQTGEIKKMNSEARFLRDLAYWNALDCFGNVPLILGTDSGSYSQISRADMFTFIESELKSIEGDLGEPRSKYSRADKASCWMLLAKLYLNAEVYTGSERYTDCLTYLNKIIASGYVLNTEYKNNFLADNNLSPEIIFAIPSDASNKSYGGTTFLICAATSAKMKPAAMGIASGWAGNRATKDFYDKFSDPSGTTDKRAIFFTDGQILVFTDINQVSNFQYGVGVMKFKNISSTGTTGSSTTFTDTDFPLFRLADAYLMYAECVLRGGSGGNLATALSYVNALRQRAYGNTSGDITSNELSLNFILDERARELYWEGQRRTDLVRFGQFTNGSYLWDLKGGTLEGMQTDSYRNIFPIPQKELNSNPDIKQNPGY
jgi:starch-binding outer membrane protein, SusD/RagB family